MKCEQCGKLIDETEKREMHGQVLCEDCYIDKLAPAKACDPWAVYTAKSCSDKNGTVVLTKIQKKILTLLQETGGLEPEALAEQSGLTPADLEREIATLRHMEKVRGELRDKKKFIRLW
jgi:hypothetical protein